MRKKLGSPPTIALTATATDDVRGDIIHRLALREPSIVVTGFDRPNLAYESRRVQKVAEKDRLLIETLRKEMGSGIIYCSMRFAVDEITAMLSENLADRSIFAYHAGMDQAARASNQERFMTHAARRRGRDQRLWHGDQQAGHSLCRALQRARHAGGVLPGSRSRRSRWAACAMPDAV